MVMYEATCIYIHHEFRNHVQTITFPLLSKCLQLQFVNCCYNFQSSKIEIKNGRNFFVDSIDIENYGQHSLEFVDKPSYIALVKGRARRLV